MTEQAENAASRTATPDSLLTSEHDPKFSQIIDAKKNGGVKEKPKL